VTTAAINSSRAYTVFQAGIAGIISTMRTQRSKCGFFCPGIAPIFTISKWQCAIACRASRCHGGTGRYVRHGRGASPVSLAYEPLADSPNPLAAFRINLPNTNPPLVRNTKRQPGNPNDLPEQSKVDDVLSRTDWNDFNNAIEDVHDDVHGWVSGDMGVVGTAAFDPIFWSHHAMIDRM